MSTLRENGDLRVGTRVEWTSQSAGIAAVKRGIVEAVIPRGERPAKTSKNPVPGAARDHVSYLVRVKGRGLYWPRVSHLRGWVEEPQGAEVAT